MKLPEEQEPAREADAIELADLGVLRVRGTDAARFLQGQLSNDVARLAAEGSLLAGYHNPQGRAIAVVRLVQAAEGDILAVLPRELVPAVLSRLARFVLRAKVQLSDDSASWRVQGIVRASAPGGLAAKMAGAPVRWLVLTARDSPGSAGAIAAGTVATDAVAAGTVTTGRAAVGTAAVGTAAVGTVPVGAARMAGAAGSEPASAGERRAWTLLDIAAGLPQVYSRTSEAFVAQMLNLDLVDGIAFSKGCYTGQEVIARAHYRGRVKRRMQRWRTLASAALAPGDSGQLADGRSFRVVEAAQLPDGRCEFLAVTSPDAQGSTGSAEHDSTGPTTGHGSTGPEGHATGPASPDGEPAGPARSPLAAESLPLPYSLPS